MKEISFEEFQNQYPLVPNPFEPSCDPYSALQFEPCDSTFDFLNQQDPRTVWTVFERDGAEDGGVWITYLLSGRHCYSDRIGFWVSSRPRPDDAEIYVEVERIPFDDDDEDD